MYYLDIFLRLITEIATSGLMLYFWAVLFVIGSVLLLHYAVRGGRKL